MWRYKKRQLVYTNCDYIKSYIELDNNNKNQAILNWLSVNSNIFYIKYKKINIAITLLPHWWKYKKLYSLSVDNINIAFIWLYGLGVSDMVEVTGSWLHIFWVDFFYFLFKKFNFKFIKFKRIDLCFDLDLDINYFFDKILDSKYKEKVIDEKTKIEIYKHNLTIFSSPKNGLETLYIWKKNIKENDYALIRIYNKILDSKKKWKLFLYDEYKKEKEELWYKNITRFELEIRERLCKFYEFEVLKNDDFLYYRIVKSFYRLNTQFFWFLKKEDFEKIRKNINKENQKITEKIKNLFVFDENLQTKNIYQKKLLNIKNKEILQNKYWSDFLNKKDEEQTKNLFVSYAKRLFKNWFSIEKLEEILKNELEK